MELPGTDRITSLLTTFLDVQSRRAQVVASNVANAETPGYRAKDLDFADFLKQAAGEAVAPSQPGAPQAMLADSPQVIEQTGAAVGMDGNTVDLGHEMSTLSETGMQYLTGTQLLQSRFRILRTAINEGK